MSYDIEEQARELCRSLALSTFGGGGISPPVAGCMEALQRARDSGVAFGYSVGFDAGVAEEREELLADYREVWQHTLSNAKALASIGPPALNEARCRQWAGILMREVEQLRGLADRLKEINARTDSLVSVLTAADVALTDTQGPERCDGCGGGIPGFHAPGCHALLPEETA